MEVAESLAERGLGRYQRAVLVEPGAQLVDDGAMSY
jgi:hypothetical protein